LKKGLEDNFQSVLTLVSGMADQIARPFETPIDVRMAPEFERTLTSLPTNLSGDVRARVESNDFGIDADGLAGAIIAGLTGATLKVDGNGLSKFVSKYDTRRSRRGK